MKIAVRCLYYRTIKPNLLILDLKEEQWLKFLWGDGKRELKMVKPFMPKAHPPIREISWIELDSLSNSSKSCLIINLTNN